MATYNKFNQTIEDIFNGVHNFSSDSLKFLLTNTAPVATNSVKANLTEISAGNGYAAGGPSVSVTASESGGTFTLSQDGTVTVTASGGSIGPFRYVVLYNDTPTSPADPLISWYDYGSSVTLNAGESLDIGGASTLFTAS